MITSEQAFDLLPSIIRVGPFDYKIERWEKLASASAMRYGECSPMELTIRIDPKLASPVKLADTLLHEAYHAIWASYGIYSEDKEERIVGSMATATVQLYRDNPWLTGWLDRCIKGKK